MSQAAGKRKAGEPLEESGGEGREEEEEQQQQRPTKQQRTSPEEQQTEKAETPEEAKQKEEEDKEDDEEEEEEEEDEDEDEEDEQSDDESKEQVAVKTAFGPIYLVVTTIVPAVYDIYVLPEYRVYTDKAQAIAAGKKWFFQRVNNAFRGGVNSCIYDRTQRFTLSRIEEYDSEYYQEVWEGSDCRTSCVQPNGPATLQVIRFADAEEGKLVYELPKRRRRRSGKGELQWFELEEWRAERAVHEKYPQEFRAAVRALLLSEVRLRGEMVEGALHLPREIVLLIVRNLARLYH
ncbi:Connector enhancer of kinase suppressor of ras 3 [Balamuthia mandrillaris]